MHDNESIMNYSKSVIIYFVTFSKRRYNNNSVDEMHIINVSTAKDSWAFCVLFSMHSNLRAELLVIQQIIWAICSAYP